MDFFRIWRAFFDFVLDMAPSMLAVSAGFWLLVPGRRRRLAGRGLRSRPAREGALFLFALFWPGLAALTLTPPDFWRSLRGGAVPVFPAPFSGGLNLTPDVFAGMLEDLRDPRSNWWSIFIDGANIGMFVPLGFFPALLWDRPRWWRSALVGGGFSLCVELLQRFVGRSSDVNDLILNTLGALAGYWLYLLLRRMFPALFSKFRRTKGNDHGPQRGNSAAHSGAEHPQL